MKTKSGLQFCSLLCFGAGLVLFGLFQAETQARAIPKFHQLIHFLTPYATLPLNAPGVRISYLGKNSILVHWHGAKYINIYDEAGKTLTPVFFHKRLANGLDEPFVKPQGGFKPRKRYKIVNSSPFVFSDGTPLSADFAQSYDFALVGSEITRIVIARPLDLDAQPVVPLKSFSAYPDKWESGCFRFSAHTLPIQMQLPPSLAMFKEALDFEAQIDQKEAWLEKDEKGRHLLHFNCPSKPGDNSSSAFLSPGVHIVRLSASLPGTPFKIVSRLTDINLPCPQNSPGKKSPQQP